MATELSQDAVLSFLRIHGGSVRNSDMLLHFRGFIREHADRDRNRELFKKFVNSVATVRNDDGVSHIVLRKQFRGTVPGPGSSGPPRAPDGKISELIPAESAGKSRVKPQLREAGGPAPPGETARTAILPAAGIMVNNNNNKVESNMNLKQKQHPVNRSAGPSGTRAAAQGVSPITEKTEAPVKTTSLSPVSEGPAQDQRSKEQRQRVGLGLKSEGGLHQEPPLHHVSLHSEVAPRRVRYRPSYKSAISCDDEEEEEEELSLRRSSGGAVWPVSGPLKGRTTSTSSSPDKKTPKIVIQDAEEESQASRGPGWSSESGLELRGQQAGPGLDHVSLSGESASTRRSLPLEAVHQDRPAQGLHPNQRVQLSSSHSSNFSPASDAGSSSSDLPPSGSSRGSNSRFDDLQVKTGAVEIQEVLQRVQGTRPEFVTHLSNSKTTASPWYHSSDSLHDDQESAARVVYLSTGDLLDNREEVESSDGSSSTPMMRHQPGRLSRDLRTRMCRSLGTDLDQILQGEEGGGGAGGGNETARLNRLHLISSSLSLRANLSSSSLSSCSTPPRCQSLADLQEGMEHKGGRRSLPAAAVPSTTPHEGHGGHGRQSLVPLEPREHTWFVKGAAGAWPDIYCLFRDDSSLLNKQDFISGFTVLHWIAKHGDHRVLNTLWYGVEKAGLTLNVNARAKCGHTPLHIAAMHGKNNMMRLLVKKFNADVRQRDIAGKKPWQYLSYTTPPDIFQLLGAPARAALGGVGRLDQLQQPPPQQRQHRSRRHHLSSAFGERPLTITGAAKVKRSTSLAAFLKHKSLLPFHGQQPDTSI